MSEEKKQLSLKEEVSAGLTNLTKALYEQADFERDSLARLSKGVARLEQELLSEDTLLELKSYEKMALYRTVSQNMNEKLKFMLDLHTKSADKGLQVLEYIQRTEKENEPKEKEITIQTKDSGSEVMEKMQSIIQNTIKKRLLETKK
jgi:hypothetical protein